MDWVMQRANNRSIAQMNVVELGRESLFRVEGGRNLAHWDNTEIGSMFGGSFIEKRVGETYGI